MLGVRIGAKISRRRSLCGSTIKNNYIYRKNVLSDKMNVLELEKGAFQIPSLCDKIKLDCCIRDHQTISQATLDSLPPQCDNRSSDIALKKHTICGAIIAHPYAPLGGSFCDPIVTAIGESFLQKGFVVGVFNFRFIYYSFFNPTYGLCFIKFTAILLLILSNMYIYDILRSRQYCLLCSSSFGPD